MRHPSVLLSRRAVALAAVAAIPVAACAPAPSRVVERVPWERARLTAPDVVTVSLWGRPPLGGPEDYCGADYTAKVAEGDARVTITVLMHSNPPPPNVRIACPAIAAEREVAVKLAAPLGQRTVVDGVTGETRPVA